MRYSTSGEQNLKTSLILDFVHQLLFINRHRPPPLVLPEAAVQQIGAHSVYYAMITCWLIALMVEAGYPLPADSYKAPRPMTPISSSLLYVNDRDLGLVRCLK
jgi:hypothetical protein